MLKTLTLMLLSVAATAQVSPPPAPVPVPRVQVPFQLVAAPGYPFSFKIDTRTGQMWLLKVGLAATTVVDSKGQAAVVYDNSVWESAVNDSLLPDGATFGRFTMSSSLPLILLDQIDGRTWLIEWADPLHVSFTKLAPGPVATAAKSAQ